MRRNFFCAIVTALVLASSAFAGMRMSFYAIPPEDARQLTTAKILSLLENPDGQQALDIDKAWHGIHFLLTGTGEPTSDVRSKTIFGGIEIGDDLGYGPARLLSPDEVKKIAAVLRSQSVEKLRARYDAKKMDALEIYPGIWTRDGIEALNYLMEHYVKLAPFYNKSAVSGRAVLIVLS